MTDWNWKYPSLGFDPLPGDPEVVYSLRHDAEIFGQRMTEQATILRRLAHREGWQGEAADAFAAHLDTLPRDLEHCGNAFSDLALALGNYYTEFNIAKRQVDDLERRATEAKQKRAAADLAVSAPAIQAPGDCPPVRDRGPLDEAETELGAILREAHDFAEHFNERPEVQQIAHAIRSFTKFAPDEPHFNILKRWAGDVFKATPVGAALNAAHEIINANAEFFNHLAGFLSELSGVIGIIALPAMFFPPLGTALAVGILGLTAASAGIKTSLYVGEARDANGHLLVKGGDLIHSYVDVALSAGAVGVTAGVARARALAGGDVTTFGKEVASQFEKDTFATAIRAPKAAVARIEQLGVKAGAKAIAKEGVKDLARGAPGRGLSWGGLVVGGVAPQLNSGDVSNAFGWKSVEHIPHETVELFHKEADTPDLQLKVEPTRSSPRAPEATMGPYKLPPLPAMGGEREY